MPTTSFTQARFTEQFSCWNGSVYSGDASAVECVPNLSVCPEANIAVQAGDVIHFSLTEDTAKDSTSIRVVDPQLHQVGSATFAGTASFVGITAVTDSNQGTAPQFQPGFGFKALNFGGMSLSSMNPVRSAQYNGKTLQIAASAITTQGGFRTIWEHA